MNKIDYFMESDEETLRLDIKTDVSLVKKQAEWAGIRPGMRVADLGFGSGKTTACLHQLAQPNGETIGVDIVDDRIKFATENYQKEGITYQCRDIREPISDLGLFDFVWIRFVLEYYQNNNFDIVKNISSLVKPGGILCLIDLDHNCLNHYGIPDRLEKTLFDLASSLSEKANFDPYAGRKLYSHLYNLDFTDIKVELMAHQVIYGALKEVDAYNWLKKAEAVGNNFKYPFPEYQNGYKEFLQEVQEYFNDPKRFTYNLAICCRGIKKT